MTHNTWQNVAFVDIKSFMSDKYRLDGDFKRIYDTCYTKLFTTAACIPLCNILENKLKEIAEKNTSSLSRLKPGESFEEQSLILLAI